MYRIRIPLVAGFLVTAATVAPLLTQAPASAIDTPASQNLTTGVAVSAIWPGTSRSMTDTVLVRATAKKQVYNPFTRRFETFTVPSSASNVQLTITMPLSFSNLSISPANGFVCPGSAQIERTLVVSCAGNIPSTGKAVAVTITTTGGPDEARYPFSSVVDPSNRFPEYNEADNAATCNVSYSEAVLGQLTGTGCERG